MKELLHLASKLLDWVVVDLLNQTNDKMYWSPVIWDILELDITITHHLLVELNSIGESRTIAEQAMNRLILEGTEFEEELLVLEKEMNVGSFQVKVKDQQCLKIYGSFKILTNLKAELKIIESEHE
jgi:hypothetical protein